MNQSSSQFWHLLLSKSFGFKQTHQKKTVQKPFSCQGKSADKLNYRDAKVLIIDHDEVSENLINSSNSKPENAKIESRIDTIQVWLKIRSIKLFLCCERDNLHEKSSGFSTTVSSVSKQLHNLKNVVWNNFRCHNNHSIDKWTKMVTIRLQRPQK